MQKWTKQRLSSTTMKGWNRTEKGIWKEAEISNVETLRVLHYVADLDDESLKRTMICIEDVLKEASHQILLHWTK